VFADIGNEQSLHQSLSTFSGHIKNIAEALSMSQKGRLFFLMKWEQVPTRRKEQLWQERFSRSFGGEGVRSWRAPHYAELKAFALTPPGFINAAMEFDNKNFPARLTE
jgi:DNA mismatch repair protein MutS2